MWTQDTINDGVVARNKHRIEGYAEGQDPLVYLVSTAQVIAGAGLGFVFTDGHGLAAITTWFNDLAHLDKLDWDVVKARYWSETALDNDRQRRKQAEFLVHEEMPWDLVSGIAVRTDNVRGQVESILDDNPAVNRPPVRVVPQWYY